MADTIPRNVTVTRDGKSYRGTYSLNDDRVTVRYMEADGTVRQMSETTEGRTAVATARVILRQLA